MKFLQDDEGIRLEFVERGLRTEVEEGSKPAAAGVRRAFRFCVILSSTEARDIRKKSERTC